MQIDTTTLRALMNTRVTVSLREGGSITGPLRGVREDKIFIQSELSKLAEIQLAAIYITDIKPDPLVCAHCGTLALNLYEGDRCAECYRELAKTRQPVTECDNCGSAPAFRNPAHRRSEFLCNACHRLAGEAVPLVGSVAGLIADCRTLDVLDPRHDMHLVRGNQFACGRCQVKVHSPELRRQLAAREADL